MAETDCQALIHQLSDHDRQTRQRARLELMQAGEAAIPFLAQAIVSSNAPLRWQAAKALSQMDAPAAIPLYIDILMNNQYSGVRWQAADGLIRFGKSGLGPLLRSLREHSDSIWLRDGAHHVLRSWHDEGIESEAIEKILHALEDTEPALGVPWAAEEALLHLNIMETKP